MLVKKKNLVAQEDLVKIFASKHPRLDSQQFLSIEIEVRVWRLVTENTELTVSSSQFIKLSLTMDASISDAVIFLHQKSKLSISTGSKSRK